MNTSKIIAAAALSILAAAGAHAETYDGVLTVRSTASRAEVNAQAVAAARVGNAYGDVVNAGVQPVLTASVDRARVQADAVATAHAPNQNLDRKAFVNSTIPKEYMKPSVSFTRSAGL